MRNNYFIRNSEKRNLFEVVYRCPGGDRVKVFEGTFNQCVIWMLIEIPDLREDFTKIDFPTLKEILEKTKLKNI